VAIRYPQLGGPLHALLLLGRAQLATLLAGLLLLMSAVAGLGWLAWQETLEGARRELSREADSAAASALRILEGQRLVANVINEILHGLADEEIRAREAELHARIAAVLRRLPTVQTAIVVDRHGTLLVTATQFPAPRELDYSSREWFRRMAGPASPELHLSPVAVGRFDGQLFFSLSKRRGETGNRRLPGSFDGAVSIAVNPNAVASAFVASLGETTDVVSLIRFDGQILVRTPRVGGLLPDLPAGSRLRAAAAEGAERGVYVGQVLFPATEPGRTVPTRQVAFRQVAGLPLYVTASRLTSEVVAVWRDAMLRSLSVALPAGLALAWLATLAWRRSRAAEAARQALLRETGLRAEAEARQEAESRFRGFFESRVVGMAVLDVRRLSVELINDRLLEMTGGTRAAFEAGRWDWRASTPPDQAGTGNAALAQARRRGWFDPVEMDYLRPDGSRLPVRISSAPLPGEAGRVAVVVQDMSAQRSTEARLALALEATNDGIWDWNLLTGEIYRSPRLLAMLGYQAGEWQDSYGGWQRLTHPDDMEGVVALLQRHLAGEDGDYVATFRMRHRDGGWRWILSRGRARRDAAGQAVRMIGTHTDITAQKQVEEALTASEAALRQVNEELEARVREEVAAREEAQGRLAQAQRMEALGQLAGGIAHDFNNVLQAVQGGARLLQGEPERVERVRRLATMVAEAAARGAAITRRLLAFARRADLRAEPVAPQELLGAMREMLRHTLGTGIEVRVQVAPGVPALLADKGQLETVLVNLAANARDAMSDSGAGGGAGALVLSAVGESVAAGGGHPAALRPGAYVRLSVSDTGVGMDAATLARAVEPFFTTKPQGKGTGLGLAMARGFAEQSGGALQIESAPGRGTTVRLWFPVSPTMERIAASLDETWPWHSGAGVRVLLVDDEPLVREITAEGLEKAGYQVLSVESAADALEVLADGAGVDVLLTDLSMPGMDGLGLIAEAQRRRPGLPAILLTGFATDMAELAVGGALSGRFSLLRKPAEVKALAERIDALANGGGGYPNA
jgi:PAS domain S-box-containing protein